MPRTRHAQIILLLADGFDEVAVCIALATLRQAGLAVSLVGLRSRRVKGAQGLVIVPDTSLDRLLETPSPILTLILPGKTGYLARLRPDPRVGTLLRQCIAEKAIVVSLEDQAIDLFVDLAEMKEIIVKIIKPDAGMPLAEFARILAQQLGELQ